MGGSVNDFCLIYTPIQACESDCIETIREVYENNLKYKELCE